MNNTSEKKEKNIMPNGNLDLQRFELYVQERKPFTFVRFSDGEIEILRNRKLVIANGITEFKGQILNNQYPEFDQKRFDPSKGQTVRSDLLKSAIYSNETYFKGIPTSHNNMLEDREFMLRLNGGFSSQITFSDLFLNSNVNKSRSKFFPFIVSNFEQINIVANWRCKLSGILSKGKLVQIPDDFFSSYEVTLKSVMSVLQEIPKYSLVLSSASSLSNVIGMQLRIIRPDLTFLDIGTVINDYLGLPLGTRTYHKYIKPRTITEYIDALRYRYRNEYKIKW
jgi:hypothetical protein